MSQFVPLHIHTAYEVGQSLAVLEDLVGQAKQSGFPALAITGHNCLFGVPEFESQCKSRGIQPIIGCEVDVAWEEAARPGRLILLAETQEGYANLVTLSSMLHAAGHESGLTLAQLQEHKTGLIAVSPLAMRRYGPQWADRIEPVFDSDSLYYEIPLADSESELSDSLRQRAVPGHAVRYLKPADEFLFRRFCTDFHEEEISGAHLPNSEEVDAWQERFPEAVANSLRISGRCQATSLLNFREADWPEFGDIEEKIAELRENCRQRIRMLYPDNQAAALERLNTELQMARQGGRLIHLAVMADLSEFVRCEGVFLSPVWAEETSSILFYLLGLSPVDPLKFALPPPEHLADASRGHFGIILRTGFEGRMRLIEYLQQKYAGRVAWTQYNQESSARAALRKAAGICGVGAELPLRIDKMSGDYIDRKSRLPETTRELMPGPECLIKDLPTRRLVNVAAQIHRLPGRRLLYDNVLLISPQRLEGLVPLDQPNHREQTTTQYTAETLQHQGLISVHLWPNKAARIMEETLLLIRSNGKPMPDLGSIPLDAQSILAEAEEQKEAACGWREFCVKEIVEARWLEWFKAEYPVEFAGAAQRVEEMDRRCGDGR